MRMKFGISLMKMVVRPNRQWCDYDYLLVVIK